MGLFINLSQGMPMRNTPRRPSRLIALIVSFLILALFSSDLFPIQVAAEGSASEPNESYCINYQRGLIKSRVTFDKERKTLDFYLYEFGETTNCQNVAYNYSLASHTLYVRDLEDANTCLGKQVARNHISIKMTYMPKEDALSVKIETLDFTMAKCS